MNCLLDTHVFLWMLASPDRLASAAAAAIQSPNNTIFVSAVTSVEIAIKRSLGKLKAPPGLSAEIARRGMTELPFTYAHGEAMESLPWHHQDPFDRMLVAQARHEELTLITHDRKIESYDVNVLWT